MFFKKCYRILRLIFYGLYFFIFVLKELIKSSYTVCKYSCMKNIIPQNAKYIVFHTKLNSAKKIFVLSHVITLTPGTIVVNCDVYKKELLIHCLFCENEESIKIDIQTGFERILEKI